MRFSDYLTETLWAALDKALPLLYGVGYVLVVVRVLPKNEFGLLGIIEVIFYFILAIDISLVQTPMAKFAAEAGHRGWAIANGFLLSAIVLSLFGFGCLAGKAVLAKLFNAPALKDILWCLALLLAASYIKNLTSYICIARQWTGRLFVIDVVYFLGSLAILIYWNWAGMLATATQVILANVYMAVAASAIGAIFTSQVLLQLNWRIKLQDTARFFSFGKYSFASGMGAYLNGYIDTIFIARFFDPVAVASYRAGKVIYRLYNAFSQAAQVIVLPLASKLQAPEQKSELRALFEKSVFFSYVALLPLNALLLIGAGWMFSLLYSGQYPEAISVFRWLVVGAFFLPWGTIGINMLLGAGKPKWNFRITWMVVAANIICSFFLIRRLSINGAAIAIAITSAVGAILTTYYAKSLTQFTWQGIMQRRADVVNFVKTLRRGKVSMSRERENKGAEDDATTD
jgi:O-antigen/teichoic acid export membrane protein